MGTAQKKSTFPKPMGFVNDYEGDFSSDEARQLNDAVKSLLAKTMEDDSLKGLEIVVVTVTEAMFGDEKEISDYATQLGDKWGVGKHGVNKAIIIAYGKKIRKVSIVTGSDLDRVLPPVVCRRIIDERMAPEFKQGKFFNALMGAVDGLREYLILRK
jgi:uncharacterized protein